MSVATPYYGLIRGDVERPPDVHLLDSLASQLRVEAVQLAMSSSAASEHVAAITATQISVAALELSMASSGVDEHVILASATSIVVQANLLSMSSSGIDEHVVSATPSSVSVVAEKLSMSSSGVSEHVLAATSSRIEAVPDKLSLSSSAVAAHVLSSGSSQVQAVPDKLSLSSSTVDEHVISVTPSDVDILASPLSMSSSGVGEHFLAATGSSVRVEALGLPMTSSGVGEHFLAETSTRVAIEAIKLQMVSSGVGEHVLGGTPTQLTIETVSLPMSSSGVGEHELASTPTQLTVSALSLSMASSGVTEHELTATSSQLSISSDTLALTSTPVVGEAACFQGAGYMYADNMLAGGYNEVPDSGYISIYFRYDGGNPDELFTWKNTLFQAHRADESHLEFRLEALAPNSWPDMVIESNDDTGAWFFATDLEADGGPYLYDGNWHHLVFGNDFGRRGWYFWADGVRYEGRTGTNQALWFKHVQAQTAVGNFEEINHVATRIGAPGGTQNLYGCIDEVMVVNNRTWGNVNGSDIPYLWNSGGGRLIVDVEAQNPNGLWDAVFNAWRFGQDPTEQFGYEYKDPDASERYSLTGTGYVIISEGIPGVPP